ncbi:neutral alpha-glucosidase C isoform X1 [Osmerus eperlanus]|uniref:neutral alpha-glucosidase C isoform X1 n=1 Tax=Osmerus eperlanus TaxID=29151 RepID=UPI002E1382D5
MADEGCTETIVSVVPDDEGKEKFKKCDQIAFHRRQVQGPTLHYCALLDTLVLKEKVAIFEVLEPDSQVRLLLTISAISNGNAVRIFIDELQPIKARYRVQDVLIQEPICEPLRVQQRRGDSVSLTWGLGQHQARVWSRPLRVEVLCGEEVVVTFNPTDKLRFETLQNHSRTSQTENHDEQSGLHRETFRQFVDIQANGPSSVGADFRFHGFRHVYGLPEHADSLLLKDTRGSEPYRLYNLDVFAYKTNSRLGLYGSVPLLLAHRPDRTLGLFWLNTSETLVDVHYTPSHEERKRSRVPPQTDVGWLSESGVLDCMVLLGPTPHLAFSQYAQLTGPQALPPLFSLGYHQSRWNYDDEADVKAVDAGFDLHAIPYDVIWLDIEHTDGKRYFTWDPVHFPDPLGLQRHLVARKRKLVVISDPHLKMDPGWPLYNEARNGGHFVKDREGNIYQGSCWPGESCYLDYSNPATRSWYSTQFSLDKYTGSTPSLFVWNDMNEPSVFGGPEQTMPKDTVHHGGWEHRDLHNLYGFLQHMSTAEGLVTRSAGSERSFVLSRSFFAGSQRFGAVWTGDNVASWEYLQISIPMLLSLSVVGVAFCGADVGGFVKDPHPELLVRWYQAGSLQPFFRGHSAITTRRREPWLFGDAVTAAIRSAVQSRYRLLPYWYTLFYLSQRCGLAPLRPLWVEFPREENTFSVDHQYMIGAALLVCPVTEAGAREVQVVLPGSGEVWYDVQSMEQVRGGQTVRMPVTLDTVPVFQRGGTVVPRRAGCGSCTADLELLPFCLTVALGSNGGAVGELYLDNGHSFGYRDRKDFCLRRFSMLSGRLVCCCASEEGRFTSGSVVQSVIVMGMSKKPSRVTAHISAGSKSVTVKFGFEEAGHVLTVTGLNLKVEEDWEIHTE